ncbi:SE1561 family protein [Pontibacillus salicampi]|uniref:SE1561 family protein n=1 Tax=Pontibacillus salicampi TaxID=1449801 RepID=A0ABV6LI96_9BACI
MSQDTKMEELKLRLSAFMTRIDELDPEETSVEDVDQLIKMIEELENKVDRS